MKIRYASMDDLAAIAEIEAKCFPAAEAAEREVFEKRLAIYQKHFWILEEEGKLVSVINGMATDEPVLQDEMYENASLHEEKGAWQMIFGVETAPEYQGHGYAAELMEHVIEDVRAQGRKGLVLTCKDKLIRYYEKFGFVNEGISSSEHGGVCWYAMRLKFEER